MKSIYLAGPITGCNFNECTDWRKYIKDQLAEDGIVCYSPMRGKEYLKNMKFIKSAYKNMPLSTQKGIMTRDRFDTMRCDILVANLVDAEKVSIGTVMEIAWADMLRTPIVLIMGEGNIHDHPMLKEAVGFIVKDEESACELVREILNA